MTAQKKKIFIVVGAVLVVGIILAIIFGIKGCSKDNSITYVSSYDANTSFIFEGENVTYKIVTEEGTIAYKGTFKEEAYTTVNGAEFTHAILVTEGYLNDVLAETISETLYFRYVGDDIEYLSKEAHQVGYKDDIVTFNKQ